MNAPERMADIGAGSSFFIWFTARALEWQPILQATAFIVSIIAGTLAAILYLRRLFGRTPV